MGTRKKKATAKRTRGKSPPSRVPERALQLTERELQRIILDIHDGPVQHIFAALSQLDLLEKSLDRGAAGDPEDVRARAGQAAKLLEASLAEIRNFIGTFRPPEFEHRTLRSVLEGLIVQHEELTGGHVDLHADAELPKVSLPVKIALYRVLQEALSNAYRHAGVNHQEVTLRASGRTIALEVIDRGAGFDPHVVMAERDSPSHIGLRGMRDRVELLGGSFSVQSAPGRGTRIAVRLRAGQR